MPAWLWVRELNSFTNAMMLIPCGPSAVPTGGAGVACPAGICNFTNPVTFFAIHTPFSTVVSHFLFSVRVVADELLVVRRWSWVAVPALTRDR